MDYQLPLHYLKQHAENRANDPYLHQPVNREVKVFSFADVADQAARIASGLLAQGYEKGDRIAILAKNSAEWFITDFAIQMAGMVSVPIYATAGAETIQYVLDHSQSKAIFVGKLKDHPVFRVIRTSGSK